MSATPSNELPVVIVGSGFSGIAMGVLLRKAGIESFVILEKAGDVGGTWRENTYPGAACDVPSHLYSFSFEPNPDWSYAFSPQAEIHEYLRRCVDRYDLARHLRFHHEVTGGEFDAATGSWTVRLAGREPIRARALVLGNGALHVPSLPDIPGLADFEGRLFHSARWDHDFDLTGKTVAVIGTGASAIQFVPQIAPKVRQLHLFQRTPPWIVPKPDREMRSGEKRWFRRLPLLQRLYRAWLYALLESPRAELRGRLVARPDGRALRAAQPRRRGARPRAAPEARAELRDRLQAHPALERLLPGAPAPERRGRDGGHRAHHRGRRRRTARDASGRSTRSSAAPASPRPRYLAAIDLVGLGGRTLGELVRESRRATSASRSAASRTSSC